jgi:hypothetical protein
MKLKKKRNEINFSEENYQIGNTYNVRLKSKQNKKFMKIVKSQKDIRNIKNGLFWVFKDEQF